MLRFSKKSLYALEAVVDIAYNARPDPVQSKDVAQRQGIPRRYLEQVMQNLVRAGILRGVRGPRGGYRLARERRRITAGDVFRVVAEFDDLEEDQTASAIGRSIIRPLSRELQETLLQRLDEITLEDLCRLAEANGIDGAFRERTDFAI